MNNDRELWGAVQRGLTGQSRGELSSTGVQEPFYGPRGNLLGRIGFECHCFGGALELFCRKAYVWSTA